MQLSFDVKNESAVDWKGRYKEMRLFVSFGYTFTFNYK